MSANALLQTRIDPAVKERAAIVLEGLGLTVSDAVRMLLTRIATDGALPFDLVADRETYDRWFRAKVLEALNDPSPAIPDEEVEKHIEADNPRAAISTDERIQASVRNLLTFPMMGRPGRVEGTRELVISGLPCIAAYRIERQTIRILRVLHSSRLWPEELP
jgi:DNA-damage-inducible protein J